MSEARLHAVLARYVRERRTLTYGALAAEIGLDGAGRIQRVTSMLERMMEEDTALRRPLRAAVVLSRRSYGLPARGFFEKATELGHEIEDPAAFHAAQLSALFAMAD